MPEESYKPQLQIATFCQSALQEINGSLSIIRLIDRHMIQGSQREMLPTNIETTLVIVMKSGFMRGKAMIGVQGNTPSGKQMPMIQLPVLFEGEDRGVGLIMPMNIAIDEEGLYWFDISVDGERFTRVALRVLYQQQTLQLSLAPPPSAS